MKQIFVPVAIAGGIALVLGIIIILSSRFFAIPVNEKLEAVKESCRVSTAAHAVSVDVKVMPRLWQKKDFRIRLSVRSAARKLPGSSPIC